MAANSGALRLLLLAGGRKSGSGAAGTKLPLPKHLLEMPDGRPLYQHQIDLLQRACPDANTICISLGRQPVLDGFLQACLIGSEQASRFATGSACRLSVSIQVRAVDDYNWRRKFGGVRGYAQRFRHVPHVTWLVVICDYPLLRDGLVNMLREAYKAPVTCILDSEGRCEPFLGVWGPEALRELRKSSRRGAITESAASVFRRLNGTMVDAPEGFLMQLMNVDGEAEWGKGYGSFKRDLKACGGMKGGAASGGANNS